MKQITVHCEHCGTYYGIDNSRKKNVLNEYIKYAVCPDCHTPRDAAVWDKEELGRLNRCVVCHRPCPTRLKKGLCTSHYIKAYRKEVSLESSHDIISSIFTLIYGIQERNWYPRRNAQP